MTAARIHMETMTPSVKTRPCIFIFLGSFPESWTKPRTLTPRTGKTHGMRLRMSPPPKMSSAAKRKVVFSISPMIVPSLSVMFPSASVKRSSLSIIFPASSIAFPSSSMRSSVMMLILESRSYFSAIFLAISSLVFSSEVSILASVVLGVGGVTLTSPSHFELMNTLWLSPERAVDGLWRIPLILSSLGAGSGAKSLPLFTSPEMKTLSSFTMILIGFCASS